MQGNFFKLYTFNPLTTFANCNHLSHNMGENEPRTYGKRGDVFNKAFTLTVQSSLRPLIDEECFEELFGNTFKDKQLGLDILKKFYGACKLSIEVCDCF